MKSMSVREVFTTLQQGSSGAIVVTLQKKLQEYNFNPGSIDGIFGQDTAKALIAFQKSVGLTPDGIAGRNTWAALNKTQIDYPSIYQNIQGDFSIESIDNQALFTVDTVSQMFYDAPRSNIVKYLPLILNALEKLDLGDRNMILIALSTIRAESASFAPISEFQSRYNTTPGKHAFNRYDFRSDLGNGALGDGSKYKGRGFIQLTGKANYRQYSKRLGMGDLLITNPELANDPEVAADLLAYFLKDKENVIRQDLAKSDLRAARTPIQ